MKIGAENKKEVIIMVVLMAIAIPLLIYTFSSVFGSGSSSTPAAASAPAVAPVAVAPVATERAPGGPSKKGILKIREKTLDPTLRTDILAASQKIEYSGSQRNIFRMADPEATKIPPLAADVRPTLPPGPTVTAPQIPQIPLKYYGFSNRPGEAKKAFLQDGDNIFVAVEGDVVERRYRIVKITNNSVLVEDVLNNNQQSINLTPIPGTTG